MINQKRLNRLSIAFVIGLAILAVVMSSLLAFTVNAATYPPNVVTNESVNIPNMVRASLGITDIVQGGITYTLQAANSDGHAFSNDGNTFFIVANGSASTITATFVTPGSVGGLDIEDLEVPVAAGATKFIGPLAPSFFNQITGSDKGSVYVNYSSVTTVTVGAFRLN